MTLVQTSRRTPLPGDPLDVIPAGFEPMHPAVLNRLNRWDVEVYLLGKPGQPPVLLRNTTTKLGDGRLEQLIERLDRRVLVRTQDYQALSVGLMEALESLPGDVSLPEADRFAMLQTAAAAEVEASSVLINQTRFLAVTQKLGRSFVDLIKSGQVAPRQIYEVARHDRHTFTHITNVCCYALVLADALGVTDLVELEQIAIGALVHDAGKRSVPTQLLRKTGPLTPEERLLIQQHPQWGYEDLVRAGGLTPPQLLMVYQHHEWVNGAGYPVGITGEEIHPWSKMLAVVDVFDALTGRRPYRPAITAEQALAKIQEDSGKQFDEDMVSCWSEVIRR